MNMASSTNPLRLQLKRLARRLVWPRPAIYAPVAMLKHRRNIFRTDYQLYIDAFPRSGNTFALRAFLLANPGLRIRSRVHIPAFIVQSAKCNHPGMVLIRNPVDAVISWSIYMKAPLRHSLAYYNDYHSVLLKQRDRLFFVSFEAVIRDFGKVMTDFNTRWGTSYVPFVHTPENVAVCLAQIEAEYADAAGKIAEMQVPRPSIHRQPVKQKLLQQLDRSRILQDELRRANELFQRLATRTFAPRPQSKMTKTTQSIRLRPAM
jgi:hypothetical protein